MPRSRSMRPSSRGARCAALAGAMSHLLRSHPWEAPAPSASWRSTHDPRRAITTRRSQACSESPVGRGRRRSRPACETNRKHPYGASPASGCSPTATRRLRMASLQIEHPDRCAFVDNEWQWRTLGNECQYFCRGIDYPISTPAWRGLLPCPATVARGHHFRVRATPMWAAIVLIVLGAEMSVSRLEQDCKAPGISQPSERGVSPSLRCLGLRSRSHTSSNGEMPYPC